MPGLVGVETTDAVIARIDDALALLRRSGFLEQAAAGGGTDGRGLRPIDAIVSDWDEFSEPRILDQALPFRSWQCEALLNQAADLLQRCQEDRARYDGLRERFASLWIEVIAAHERDEIANQDLTQARLDKRLEQIERTRTSAQHQARAFTLRREHVEAQLALSEWNPDSISSSQGVLDKARTLDTYWGSAVQRTNLPPTGYMRLSAQALPDVAGETLPDFVGARVKELTRSEMQRQVANLKAAYVGYHDEELGHACQADAARDEKLEAEESQRLALESAKVQREQTGLQVLAMTEPGGPLNFPEQMRPIQQRFVRDLADAYARLVRAQWGLLEIYGYPEFLPDPKSAETQGYSFLDLLINWVRQSAAFLARFNQRDQVLIHTMSLKRAADSSWEQSVNAAGADPVIRFEARMEPPWRGDVFYPRIRGIALHLVPKAGSQALRGVFAGRVRPPSYGETTYFVDPLDLRLATFSDGRVTIPGNISTPWSMDGGPLRTKTGIGTIDQRDAPYARVGRVQPRNSIDGTELVGTVTLMNLSPVAPEDANEENRVWRVEVEARSSQDESFFDVVDDIEVEVHVAYQERLK